MASEVCNRAETTVQDSTVLLVEDDPETLLVMAAVLRQASCSVFTATHEDVALALLRKHPQINVIVTDACFGDGGKGRCMAEQVRLRGSHAAIVVTCTDPDASCATLGDTAIFLLKPYGRQALLDAVVAATKAHAAATAVRLVPLDDATDQTA